MDGECKEGEFDFRSFYIHRPGQKATKGEKDNGTQTETEQKHGVIFGTGSKNDSYFT